MTGSPKDQMFDAVEDAVAEIAAGRIVIVTDDESRENEGDMVMAASKATPEMVNMMIQHARGLICVPTTEHQLRRLGVNPMVQQNREAHRTDFTVSVDAAQGITTGISAYDRATTIRIIADPAGTAQQLVQPGHVFPLRARPGGVLERAGHTEAAVDLASLAGQHPSGVICEILNEDGTCARLAQLVEVKKRFGLKMISIAELIEYRHRRDCLVEKLAAQPFRCRYGDFTLHVFRNLLDNRQHMALTLGELDEEPTLVRVQSQNLLSDVFACEGTHGRESIDLSLEAVAKEGKGALLYMVQDNGGLSLERNAGTSAPIVRAGKMGFRDYGIGAQILSALGLRKIRLLSHQQRKVVALDGYGLEIVELVKL